jgi:two-component system response regulator
MMPDKSVKRIRGDQRTKLAPAVTLPFSEEEPDLIDGHKLGANSCIGKPVDFDSFFRAEQELGVYGLMANEPPAAPGRES